MDTCIKQDSTKYISDFLSSHLIKPIVVTDCYGEQNSFLFKHKPNNFSAYFMMKIAANCDICASRFRETHSFSDENGSIWNCLKDIDPHCINCDQYKQVGAFADSVCESEITGVIMIKPNERTLFKHFLTKKNLYHVTRPIHLHHMTTAKNRSEYRSDYRSKIIHENINKYIMNGHFDNFFGQLIKLEKALKFIKNSNFKLPGSIMVNKAIDWCLLTLSNYVRCSKKWKHFTQKEKIIFALQQIIHAGYNYHEYTIYIHMSYKNIIIAWNNANQEDAILDDFTSMPF